LPVVAVGVWGKWLIISVFWDFCWWYAIAGLLLVSLFLGLHKIAGLLPVVDEIAD